MVIFEESVDPFQGFLGVVEDLGHFYVHLFFIWVGFGDFNCTDLDRKALALVWSVP